jgi:hypothetical protein
MLRKGLIAFATLLILWGMLRALLGDPGAFVVTLWGLILLAAVLFERWRYQKTARAPKIEWQGTDERFVDPETGVLTQVMYDPRSGERIYRPIIDTDKSP